MYLCNHYIPEEVLTIILSNVLPDDLLNLSLVCRCWNRIIKSTSIWHKIYMRKFPNRKIKQLPWYVYYVLFTTTFFDSVIKGTSDIAKRFKEWPNSVREGRIINRKSCLPSYNRVEYQKINLSIRKVYLEILKKCKPHILVSNYYRWNGKVAVQIICTKSEMKEITPPKQGTDAEQKFQKEIIIDDYPEDIKEIVLIHDTFDDRKTYSCYCIKIPFDTLK